MILSEVIGSQSLNVALSMKKTNFILAVKS